MKIVIGYKGTNVGHDLVELAEKQARAFHGEIFILTSLPGGEKTTKPQALEAEYNLESAKSFFDKKNIPVSTHLLVRGFTAGEDIVKFARENDAELIIIGVKSRSKLGKLIFGSTAQYVILQAHCPVMTIK